VGPLTEGNFRCDVCGANRPFDDIGVAKHIHILPSGHQIDDLVNFCRDKPGCMRDAAVCNHAMLATRKMARRMKAEAEEARKRRNVNWLNAGIAMLVVFFVAFYLGVSFP
jgi:hypothetical protein